MSLIRFTSLSGANDGSTSSLSHVLQVDNCRILLDCGASAEFDPVDFRALGSLAKNIDVVLLTHADIQHIGGYVFARAKLGLNCPCYATGPVAELGKLAIREYLHNLRTQKDFILFGADEVNDAFNDIITLRYSQETPLSGKGTGITITAFLAGHSVGGTFWKIKKGTDEILYAVDYNHIKERHLDRTQLNAEELKRPSVLITDAYNGQYNFLESQNRRPARDKAFFENIQTTLQSGGNVLVPITTSTRSLELTFLLEDYWSKNPNLAKQFPHVYFLSPQSNRVLHAARRNTEWMGDGVAKILTQQHLRAPFDFAHIRAIASLDEIDSTSSAPKLIFAGDASLASGFARRVFLEWCKSRSNLVLLPERGEPGSLARQLYDEWLRIVTDPNNLADVSNIARELPDFTLNFAETRRVPLEGEEKQEFERQEAARKDAAAAAAEAAKLAAMEENDSDMSDDDDDGPNAGMGGNGEKAEDADKGGFGNLYDIYVKDANRTGGFFKQNASYRMFPVSNPRGWIDDYGEAVDPAMFATAETAAMEEMTEELPEVKIEETRDPQDLVPSKYVTIPIDLRVACKIVFVDFEGRSDGPSVKKILPQVAARKLVLVHGSQESTASLEAYCRETDGITNDVFAPHNNEWINISAASDIYEIKLTDSLVSSLVTAKISDYELAYVSGYIKFDEQDVDGGKQGGEDGAEANGAEAMDVDEVNKTRSNALVPTLDILPAELCKSHSPVIVGDLRLSEFRKVLVAKGFETEFVSGVLVVNRSIMIRKSHQQQGRLLLEGSLSRDYYECRKLLYAEHAIL